MRGGGGLYAHKLMYVKKNIQIDTQKHKTGKLLEGEHETVSSGCLCETGEMDYKRRSFRFCSKPFETVIL